MSTELAAGIVGGVIGVAGGVIVVVAQILHDRSTQRSARRLALAEKRRLACVELLSTTRRIRQVTLRTFQRREHETDIDGIYSQMYAALYTVKSICQKEAADLAQQFFDESLKFWQLSFAEPDAPAAKWQTARRRVKDSVQKFRSAIRRDYALAIGEDLKELNYS